MAFYIQIYKNKQLKTSRAFLWYLQTCWRKCLCSILVLFVIPFFTLSSYGQTSGLASGMGALPKKIWMLTECINQALEKNPKILVAKQSIEQSKGVVIQAKAVLYPSINANNRIFLENHDVFDQNQSESEINKNFRSDWVTTVTVQYNFFSGGANSNNIAAAKLQNEVEFIKLQEAINDINFQVTKVFYDVLLSQAESVTIHKNIDLLIQEVSRQKSLFEAGQATKFNIVRTEVRLANEQASLVDVQNRINNNLLALYDFMGLSWPESTAMDKILVEGVFDCPKIFDSEENLVKKALMQSPLLSRRDKEIEIQQHMLNVAKANNVPKFDFFAGTNFRHNKNSPESNFFDNSTEAAFGIMGSWNIFDGFLGRAKAIQARAQIKAGEIQRKDTARQIQLNVRKAFLNLQQAEKSVKTQEGNVQRAFDALNLAKSSVEAGFGTQFDILQTTVDYSTAQNIVLRARYQYHLALATLEQLLFSHIQMQDAIAPVLETQPEPLSPQGALRSPSSSES